MCSLGQLLHRGEAHYPPYGESGPHLPAPSSWSALWGPMAISRTSKSKSGNPLLVHAAVEAAWQWVYAPSRLNGVPIEIVTTDFCFKLN